MPDLLDFEPQSTANHFENPSMIQTLPHLVLLVATLVASLGYVLTSAHLLRSLTDQTSIVAQYVYLWLGAALLFHAITLVPDTVAGSAYSFNLFDMLSVTTWLMLLFSLITTMHNRVLALNALAAPVALFGLWSGALGPHLVENPTLISLTPLVLLHVLSSLAAYSLLFMAAVQAYLLLQQNKELKHAKPKRWLVILPPLERMETLLKHMLYLGFAVLTLALVLGFVAVDNLFAQHLAHKTLFSLAAWLIYAWLIVSGRKFGFRARRTATHTLLGFGLLALGFLGTKVALALLG